MCRSRRAQIVVGGCCFALLSVSAGAPAQETKIIGDPCSKEGATAFVTQVQGKCLITRPPPDTDAKQKPQRAALGEILRAGDSIECHRKGSVTLTYCASREDQVISHSRDDPRAGRYVVPHVPARTHQLKDSLQPALRSAAAAPLDINAESVFVQGFRNDHPSRSRSSGSLGGLLRIIGAVKGAIDLVPEDVLRKWVEKVSQNRDDAFAEISRDSSPYSFTDRGPYTRSVMTFCAGPDGHFSAPTQLAKLDLRALKDSSGFPIGEAIYETARADSIDTISSVWTEEAGVEPVKVETYVTRVEDQVCATNVSLKKMVKDRALNAGEKSESTKDATAQGPNDQAPETPPPK